MDKITHNPPPIAIVNKVNELIGFIPKRVLGTPGQQAQVQVGDILGFDATAGSDQNGWCNRLTLPAGHKYFLNLYCWVSNTQGEPARTDYLTHAYKTILSGGVVYENVTFSRVVGFAWCIE